MKEFIEKYQKVPVTEYKNTANETPVVSICVQAYNHANFIQDNLERILMQKTSFPFEVLLGEDESTDGTREICMLYAKKYPRKIRLFLHSRENNIRINGQPTGRFNLLYNLTKARGKYIALCEGDDYWIDPYKLQKQMNFMESHSSCSLSFHSTILFDEILQQKQIIKPNKVQSIYTLDEILKEKWVQMTCSLMIKGDIIKSLPDWFNHAPIGDLPLRLISGSHGSIGYIDEIMAVYRKYSLNSWSNQIRDYKWSIRWRDGMIKMYINFNQYSNNRYKSTISRLIVNQYKIFILRLINNKTSISLIAKYYCKYFKLLTGYQRITLAYKLVKYLIYSMLISSTKTKVI